MSAMSGFKKFILRGNVIDLAIGVVIGAAFALVIGAFTNGVLSPLIGLFGSGNFDNLSWCVKGACDKTIGAKDPGHLLAYGTVLTALLQFLLTAAALYFLVVNPVNRLMERRKTEPDVESTTKQCPECLSSIPAAATRCAFCTVEQ
jgi:large conductance mechanosensitive channel